MNSLDQSLTSRNATWKDEEGTAHELSLRIANAAFAQRGWTIEQAYLDAIATTFGAGLGLVDYIADPDAARKTINAWVSRQTTKRIPQLLAPPDVTELTRLVLVNAIYLKANWCEEFSVEATKARSFTRSDGSRITVPTMSLLGDWEIPYVRGAGWQATELPYLGAAGSSPLAMTLILPDDLTAFEAGLTATTLGQVMTALDKEKKRQGTFAPCDPADEMQCPCYPYALELFMPRFGIETRADLVPSLRQLGMRSALDPGSADFTGITTQDGLYIAKVIHQANIDVDEKGTVAAAATAVVGSATGGCGPPQPLRQITLRLDHPFLFVIHDVETGAILFMGRVVDPSTRS